jgi:hypothetical protein
MYPSCLDRSRQLDQQLLFAPRPAKATTPTDCRDPYEPPHALQSIGRSAVKYRGGIRSLDLSCESCLVPDR